MAWDVVVAALGGTVIGGAVTVFTNERSRASAAERAASDNEARLAQMKEEHNHQLHVDVIRRTTDLRRERLIPLQQSVGRLLALSVRYRHAAQSIFLREIGEPYDDDVDIDKEFSETRRELGKVRREELVSMRGLGIASMSLGEELDKLDRSLRAIENEAREYAEEFAAREATVKKAEAASTELSGILVRLNKLIEELVSGADLVLALNRSAA